MKRVGYLYQEICSLENCKAAIITASKGKRKRKNVKRILDHLDERAADLQKMLIEHTYVPSPYNIRYINDGIKQKRRRLAKPKFYPDQCIHHCLDRVMERVIMHGMDYYCCGSVRGRGAARAQKGIVKWLKRKPKKSKYALKMDIQKYYDSISHEEMMKVICRKVKDKEVLWLYQTILDSYNAVDPELSTEKHEVFRKGYGIPIGIDPSRWICNLFLEDIDHKIRRYLGKEYHLSRYVDDIVIIGPSKRKLHKLKKWLDAEFAKKKLSIKSNWQIFRIANRPIDYLGFKFHKDGHVELRKSIMKRIKHKAVKISHMPKISCRNAAGMISYMGWVKNSDSEYFYSHHLKGRIKVTRLRRIISHEGKIRGKATENLARSA